VLNIVLVLNVVRVLVLNVVVLLVAQAVFHDVEVDLLVDTTVLVDLLSVVAQDV
tara:strand:- start:11476 stop:11637 length:162 start_codon:yes stop_codon:yes gene_type:complete